MSNIYKPQMEFYILNMNDNISIAEMIQYHNDMTNYLLTNFGHDNLIVPVEETTEDRHGFISGNFNFKNLDFNGKFTIHKCFLEKIKIDLVINHADIFYINKEAKFNIDQIKQFQEDNIDFMSIYNAEFFYNLSGYNPVDNINKSRYSFGIVAIPQWSTTGYKLIKIPYECLDEDESFYFPEFIASKVSGEEE